MHLFLFNGPPRSGKNTAAKHLLLHLKQNRHIYSKRAVEFSLATPLKEAAHILFGINKPERYFERTKDQENARFFGKSPRQIYIDISERAIKPLYGVDFFGRIFVERVKTFMNKFQLSNALVVVTDCGFIEELKPMVEFFGKENITIVHVQREGCTYKNDSRSYISCKGIKTVQLSNNGTETELAVAVAKLAKESLLN